LLHEHAVLGYQGKAGFMPAKGGRADLTDQSVIATVDHMGQELQIKRPSKTK
jgi:cytochrome c5